MNKTSFAMSLLGDFESDGSKRVERIMMFAFNDEPELAADEAHALKGAAAILGAGAIAETSSQIEIAGRDHDQEKVRNLANSLDLAMRRCVEQIRSLQIEFADAQPTIETSQS